MKDFRIWLATMIIGLVLVVVIFFTTNINPVYLGLGFLALCLIQWLISTSDVSKID